MPVKGETPEKGRSAPRQQKKIVTGRNHKKGWFFFSGMK